MALTVNWATQVVTVPQADLTPVSGTLYELDVDAFRLNLKTLEASAIGQAYDDIHRHSTEKVLSGVTYARFVEIINGYTIEFEDGQYVVRCVGANHNLADVKVANQVSLIIGNSAGLITVVSGSGVTAQDKEDIIAGVLASANRIEGAYSLDGALRLILAVLAGKVSGAPATPVFRSVTDTKDRVTAVADPEGNRTTVNVDAT